MERGAKDAQELYEISLHLEPRDAQDQPRSTGAAVNGTPEEIYRELEAKIDLLEKAGVL